jgi:hypothetical protein
VLVDAYSEMLETLLTLERWAALVPLNIRSGSDAIEPIPGYGDLGTIGYGKDNARYAPGGRKRAVWPTPLVVLSHARPFDLGLRRRRAFRRTHWNRSSVRRT